jgi:hypothetical protein
MSFYSYLCQDKFGQPLLLLVFAPAVSISPSSIAMSVISLAVFGFRKTVQVILLPLL